MVFVAGLWRKTLCHVSPNMNAEATCWWTFRHVGNFGKQHFVLHVRDKLRFLFTVLAAKGLDKLPKLLVLLARLPW